MRIAFAATALLVTLLVNPASAQVYVRGQDINQLAGVEYIEVIINRRLFGNGESFAVIDYGQIIRWGELRANRVKESNGMDKAFGGEMDIFNFLFHNGWIHETTYAAGEQGYVLHIFRRKPTDSR